MKTDTKQRILAYIKEKNETSVKNIIAFSKISPQAVFRHLKKLQALKQIYKVGKTPKVRYYAYADIMELHNPLINSAINWSISGDNNLLDAGQHCQTRDVFQARCDRLVGAIKKLLNNENLGFLLAAIAGEIGNNSFDHNIGQWLGEPGLIFIFDAKTQTIIIADRGQGVLSTLRRVRPELANDRDALQVAFTERISGRSPEQRGNGLKFVKKVIAENNWRLTYYSGSAVVNIISGNLNISESQIVIPGTLAIINF